jgi:hypothetical protein
MSRICRKYDHSIESLGYRAAAFESLRLAKAERQSRCLSGGKTIQVLIRWRLRKLPALGGDHRRFELDSDSIRQNGRIE